jgi:hypothetical protein
MVAQASARHAKTVDICLNHIAGPAGGNEALEYIKSLDRADQEALLQQHGKTLISKFKLEMQVWLSARRWSAGRCMATRLGWFGWDGVTCDMYDCQVVVLRLGLIL